MTDDRHRNVQFTGRVVRTGSGYTDLSVIYSIHLDTQIRIVCMVIAYLDIYGLLVRTISTDGRHFVKEFIYNDILIIFGYELDFYYY